MDQNIISKIEAILFASGEPVGASKLSSFLKITAKECKDAIDQLAKSYEERNSGLQIVENRNTIQLVSSGNHGELVAKFLKKNLNEPLSNAALEVLSVIAYRGPVTRAQVEYIRGVNCSFTIRNLAIRGLVERKENPADSRSFLYEASNDFIKSLGLSGVAQLPEYEIMHSSQIPGEKAEEIENIEVKENKDK